MPESLDVQLARLDEKVTSLIDASKLAKEDRVVITGEVRDLGRRIGGVDTRLGVLETKVDFLVEHNGGQGLSFAHKAMLAGSGGTGATSLVLVLYLLLRGG